ncbi:DNA-directed RNA polymerase sigma-70 factor [Fulvitalea axinellae]|uniref:DNA-directed RNA polymerase sigma-70 factor n=2 Tax=Fulvitalea axinellae TaxID=1182444 RepID=A0AAU9CF61_9BACT|nr:DNA-directed RNA polymerase sigma-70 factor [Fulvitalea axinellae]
MKHVDSVLWSQFKQGDRFAFARIYKDHSVALLAYGGKMTVDKQLSEDCLQDFFVELWRKRHRLGPTDNIRYYLLCSYRRRLVRAIEKQNRLQSLRDEVLGHFELRVDESTLPQEISEQRKRWLQDAVDGLSKKQREILYLKYNEGLTYEEISEVLEMNYQSAVNSMHRTMKSLRRMVPHAGALVLLSGMKFF